MSAKPVEVDVTGALQAMAAAHRRRADSVPCRLEDAAACCDSQDEPCALRDSQDCPLLQAERERVERETAGAARLLSDRRIAAELGIPIRHWHLCGLEHSTASPRPRRQTAALDAVQGATDELLVLCGPTGTGKSAAASVWAWERRGMFRSAAELEAMDWYGDRRTVTSLGTCPALVIDDLGVEYSTGRGPWMARLDGVVSKRYNDRLATLITSNLTGEALVAYLGTRLVSRLHETGRIVECVGQDIRPAVRQERLEGVV